MWVQSLGQEEPLEEGMATVSGVLAWRIPWTEEPGELWPIGAQTIGCDKQLSTQFGQVTQLPQKGSS